MTAPAAAPDFATFRLFARPGVVVPISIELPFDTETAVTAYAKLHRPPFGFLLESVIGGERWARYSFLGSEPRAAWRLVDDRIEEWGPGTGWGEARTTSDPFSDFADWVGAYEPAPVAGLPRFWGGAVGFFGYDLVRWFERLPDAPVRDVDVPDACFMLTDRVLAIDNLFDRATAIVNVPIPEGGVALEGLYRHEVGRLREWIERLREPHGLAPLGAAEHGGDRAAEHGAHRAAERGGDSAGEYGAEKAGDARGAETRNELRRNRTAEDFQTAVERAREYIRAGDVYQAVLSQRVDTPMPADAFDVYRALRTLNPSPYLFFLELDGVRLIGSSPEVLVRVEEETVTVRPIAGTRPRGATPAEDAAREEELLADEKEAAEHLMLVDLGRNDVSHVAEPGSVRTDEFRQVERYSHVIHLVSEITGRLREGLTALDALRACFPAGTLTGAPKLRAMEIIDELEPTRRGAYGGAAGYIGFGGAPLDVAITIRTIVQLGGRAYIQAGAGIVHDSDPAREWEETLSKARALLLALDTAGGAAPAAAIMAAKPEPADRHAASAEAGGGAP